MSKKIPTWMASHPDNTYRCASNPHDLSTLVRFPAVYPPEWTQVILPIYWRLSFPLVPSEPLRWVLRAT
jgi:hypothetical protein